MDRREIDPNDPVTVKVGLMTGQYEAALKALAENARTRYVLERPPGEGEDVSWRDFTDDARADLDSLAEVGALNLYLVKEMRGVTQRRLRAVRDGT